MTLTAFSLSYTMEEENKIKELQGIILYQTSSTIGDNNLWKRIKIVE